MAAAGGVPAAARGRGPLNSAGLSHIRRFFSGGSQRRMTLQPFSINRLLSFDPWIIFWHEF
jgi:hypothetical protein